MNLAPSYAPTRCATPRRAVGQAASNPAGAGKWMPSPRRRGGACAPRPSVFHRGFSSSRVALRPHKFDGLQGDTLHAVAGLVVVNNLSLKGQLRRNFGEDFFGVGAIPINCATPTSDKLRHFAARSKAGRPTLFGNGVALAKKAGDGAINARRLGFVNHGFNHLFSGHGVCVGWLLSVDGFGEGHVVLFAQGLGRVLIGEATENLGALESTNDNPMGAVVVEYCHRTADGLGFGAVCFHYPHTIASRLECVNRYFKKRFDFFGGWESGTYGRSTKGAEALS